MEKNIVFVKDSFLFFGDDCTFCKTPPSEYTDGPQTFINEELSCFIKFCIIISKAKMMSVFSDNELFIIGEKKTIDELLPFQKDIDEFIKNIEVSKIDIISSENIIEEDVLYLLIADHATSKENAAEVLNKYIQDVKSQNKVSIFINDSLNEEVESIKRADSYYGYIKIKLV